MLQDMLKTTFSSTKLDPNDDVTTHLYYNDYTLCFNGNKSISSVTSKFLLRKSTDAKTRPKMIQLFRLNAAGIVRT